MPKEKATAIEGVEEPTAPALQPPDAVAETPVLTAPQGYTFVDTETLDQFVTVPATGREYNLNELTECQAEQLLSLKWPHIQKTAQ